MNHLKLFVLTGIALTLATSSSAQTSQTAELPQPDKNGNYFSNQAPHKGHASSPLMPGSLWQVVSGHLNCRSGLGTQHGIVRTFRQGELLQADVGRGGADEVLLNATDTNGNPWMRVRSAAGANYGCFVRANSRYIQPDLGK